MTPLYDPNNPIYWRDLTIEELLKAIEGRIKFHANASRHKLPDLDYDDIFQELSIVIWRKIDRVPEDIKVLDYRFMRYIDTLMRREVINMYRSRTFTDKEDGSKQFRDELNRSLPMVDNFDEIWDN